MKSLKKLPSYIMRKDDKQIFVLAQNGLYYLKSSLDQFPKNLHFGYTYRRLINEWEDDFEIVKPAQFGPKAHVSTQADEMEDELAKLDAPTRNCCRCGGMAKIYRYKAFFCSKECAESASDNTLNDGQQAVPDYLNDLNAISGIEDQYINDTNVNDYALHLAQLTDKGVGNVRDWIWKANSYQRALALLKTLHQWRS